MKHIKRKNRKLPILLSFLGIFVSALVAVIILNAFPPVTPPAEKPPLDIREGESSYAGMTIAYPAFESEQIGYISVRNHKGSYSLAQNDDGDFIFYYADENGDMRVYSPKIVTEDAAFDYESLYAMEKGDGYGVYTKLSYLCSTLQYLYFNERIELSSDAEERAEQLREYGFTESQVQRVGFVYTTKEGEEIAHSVQIGAKLLTNDGRYFMVDNRPYIYSSVGTTINYALAAFSEFVNPRLVAAGLSEDNGFGPYLVSDFKEWRNTLYDEEGDELKAEYQNNATVIVTGKTFVPVSKDDDSNPLLEGYVNGYSVSESSRFEIPLSEIADNSDYSRLVNALVGRRVGVFSEPVTATLGSSSRWVDLGDKESVKYTYTVTAVEAIITDSGEISEAGTPVGNNSLIKITYNYSVDGKAKNLMPCHGLLDLESALMPEGKADELRALSVGALAAGEQVTLELTYTKESSVSRTVEIMITDIVAIYDGEYAETDVIAADSIVSYRYVYVIDGARGSTEYSTVVNLATDESEEGAEIKGKIIGKKTGRGQNIKVFSYTAYGELVSDFITYEITEMPYFYTSEKIASFRFVNASDRDPFYGESIYENTLDNKYRIYGINASSCQEVAKVLGGIGDTTGVADGLIGSETVAIGLTPEVMEKYGLYAYTVYYELPRGIIVTSSGDEYDDESLDDYTWHSTLGFTLYISEENPVDGTRYVGSDMYDVVVKISGDYFIFLDYDFTNFWARSALMLFDVKNVESIDLEFNMSDLKGSYDFDLSHTTLYIGSNGMAYISPDHIPEGSTVNGTYDKIVVDVTPEGECTENELTKYIAKKGYDAVSLTELYNEILGGGEELKVGNGSAGSAHFKTLMQVCYIIRYEGTLAEEEQAAALDSEPVMTFSVKLSFSPYRYVYEFYRVSERQVMVRIYQANADGTPKSTPVSDFYISTYSFKKIVSGYLALLNAEELDEDYGYID